MRKEGGGSVFQSGGMNVDLEEQEDELLALHSIFDSEEEFTRDGLKPAGIIRVSVRLPEGFKVALRDGETQRQYEISSLPPLNLTFELPENYPSSSPPSFALACGWLTRKQLGALSAHLVGLHQAGGGAVVLFSWVQFLKEDALAFLDIGSLLELQPAQGHDAEEAPSPDTKSARRIPACDQRGRRPSDTSEPEAPELGLSFPTSGQSERPSQSEGDFPASFRPPSASSLGGTGESGEGAAPLEPSPSEDRTPSGLPPTPAEALLSRLLISDAAHKRRVFASSPFDCGLCWSSFLGSECVQLRECGHVFCRACLAEFCKLRIGEGNVRGVACPQEGCPASPTPAQVKALVGDELFSRYDRLLLQSTLDRMPDVVYCPRHSCGSAVIMEPASRAALCSVCGFAFCVACRRTYHGTQACWPERKKCAGGEQLDHASLPQSHEGLRALWDDYASGSRQRRRVLESRYGRGRLQVTVEDCLSDNWVTVNSKPCPHCFCRIQKDSGCNVMTCSQCGQLFCWVCLADLRSHASGHFYGGGCSLLQYHQNASPETR